MEPLSPEELSHRDHLARERTHLANERTFLSYLRTAVSFMVLGVALVHFILDTIAQYLGWFSIAVGVAILGTGLWRFRHIRARIRSH